MYAPDFVNPTKLVYLFLLTKNKIKLRQTKTNLNKPNQTQPIKHKLQTNQTKPTSIKPNYFTNNFANKIPSNKFFGSL